MLVGLTGGMACGKTFVANTFASLGAYVIEADELGRAAMEPGGKAFHPIVAEFGQSILDETGRIDRAALARVVFADEAALAKLNAIVHPLVREALRTSAQRILAADRQAIVIYVAAILIESGGHLECEKIVVVSCTPEQQIERAMQRDSPTEISVRARLARQLPLEQKLALADFVIDASGTKQETVRQTKLVYTDLQRLST